MRRWHVLVAALAAAALALPTFGLGLASGTSTKPSIGPGEGKLTIVGWDGLLDGEWVKPFERNTGCKINAQVAGSSNQLVAYMRAGGGGKYDLVSASADVSGLLIAGKDVRPIDVGLIPEWRDFLPVFKSGRWDTLAGVHYGIPTHWIANRLLYNANKVKPPPVSWGAIYDPKRRGEITVPNVPMQIGDAALYLMRTRPALAIRDPYELTKPQFAAAVALLTKQKPLVAEYWNYPADEISAFKSGRVTLGSGWPWQASVLRVSKFAVRQATPKEGMTGWVDTWMLSAKVHDPNCAYRWLRYVSTPSVQAEIAVSYGAAPVNAKTCALMETRKSGSCAALDGNASPALLRSIRFWKTPEAACGFGGRKDCVPYVAWEKAWVRITS